MEASKYQTHTQSGRTCQSDNIPKKVPADSEGNSIGGIPETLWAKSAASKEMCGDIMSLSPKLPWGGLANFRCLSSERFAKSASLLHS